MKRVIIVFHLILFYFSISLSAQDTNIHRDTLFANIKFRQGYSQLDSTFNDNQMHLNQLITLLDSTALDSSLVLKSITIKGSASPEGSTPMNRQLSEKRAQSMKAYIVDHTTLNDFNIKVDSSDVDWEFLSEMIASTDLPWRDEAVKIIANTPIWVFKDKKIVDGRKKQLCMLQGGHAWEYMSKNFFPALRARFRIMCEWEISRPANNRGDECKTDECETIVNQPSTEERLADVGKDSVATSLVPDMRNTVSTDSLAFTAKSEKDRKFVMLLKTNMLYDVMAIPNIGIEIPITPKWSASANWMLLALNPPGHAHGVPLQELRGHQRGTPALGQPVPGGLVDFGGDERLAVLLGSGEHGGGLGHRLALQIGGGVKVGDGQPPPAGVALGDLVRQGLFLGPRAHTSAAPVGAVFGHDFHLLLLPGVYTLFETAILRK